MREDIYEALKKFLVENQDEVKQDGIVRCGDLVLIQGDVYIFCTSKARCSGFVALNDGNRWNDFTEYPPNTEGYAIKQISGSDVTRL